MAETIYSPLIEELRDKSDKETNKQQLFDEYQKLYNPKNPVPQMLYVQALIEMQQEQQEKCHYIYLNHYNDYF